MRDTLCAIQTSARIVFDNCAYVSRSDKVDGPAKNAHICAHELEKALMGRHEYDLATQARKPTNVSLDIALVAEAKRLGINISRACEVGLIEQIAKERGRLWKEENASALESSNNYVEGRGLPLSQYRRF